MLVIVSFFSYKLRFIYKAVAILATLK